jgi:hypothetical protein
MHRPEKNERINKRRQSLVAAQLRESQLADSTQLFSAYSQMPETRIDANTQKSFQMSKKRDRFANFLSPMERNISSSFSMQMSDFNEPSPMYTSLHLPNKREAIGITVSFTRLNLAHF